MTQILEMDLPVFTCNNDPVIKAYQPEIISFAVDNTYSDNYDTLSNIQSFITLNNSLYVIDNGYGCIIRKFNIATNTFDEPITIDYPNYASCIVGDEGTKLYLYGGRNKSTSVVSNQLYVYDVVANTCTLVGTGGTARYSSIGSYITDKLFFFGGTVNGTPLNYFTEYVISTNTWTVRDTTPHARIGGTIIGTGTDLYMTGANQIVSTSNAKLIWKYDSSTNAWSQMTETVSDLFDQNAIFRMINGQIHLINKGADDSAEVDEIISAYTPGTGFTPIFGSTATPAIDYSGYVINSFKDVCYFDSILYFKANIADSFIPNTPTLYLIGKIDLTLNKIIKLVEVTNVGTITIKVKELLTTRTDTPSKVKFEYSKIDNSITPIEVEQDYMTDAVLELNTLTYTLAYLNTTENITQARVAFKPTIAEYSNWSLYAPKN